MDNTLYIEDIKILVKEFCETRDWDQFHNPKDLAIGISTEANELLDIFRFKNAEEMNIILKNSDKRQNVEDEIADVLFFVLRFAQMNQIDLATALKAKIEMNNQKYPVNKSKGKNSKYSEF